MELVCQEGLKDMSVMASPMGYELYKSLGWDVVGTFWIQVPGEEEKLVLRAMMYKPPKLEGSSDSEEEVQVANGRCAIV